MTITKAAIKLNSAWRRRWPKWRALPPLWLMSDPARLADPIPYLHHLPPGSGVIYRCYGTALADSEQRKYTQALMTACHGRDLQLLIAGNDRLALEIDADGIHLPEWHIGQQAWRARAIKNRGGLVTASCHTRRALTLAARAGADAALLAPVFATDSHPGTPNIGPLRFAALARESAIPVYALGGIGPDNISLLKGSGTAGIAAIGAIIGNQNAKG
jgi:thiamine-phosphate pyrophosphorylase